MPRSVVPGLGEHVLFCGENGEGKTYLAAALLQEFSQTHPVIVFDTKGEDKFDVWTDSSDWRDVIARQDVGEKRSVYRPQGDDLEPEVLDSRILELYNRGWSGAVYLDDLEHVAPNSVALPGLKYTLVSGRRRRIPTEDGGSRIAKMSLWQSAHRPKFIPNYSKNEPKHYFIFGLSEDDLKTMRPYMHDTPMTRPPRKHFWYYQKGEMDEARFMMPVRTRGE